MEILIPYKKKHTQEVIERKHHSIKLSRKLNRSIVVYEQPVLFLSWSKKCALYHESLEWCPLEGINKAQNLSIGGNKNQFSVRTEFHARPIAVLVLCQLEGGERTLKVNQISIHYGPFNWMNCFYLFVSVIFILKNKFYPNKGLLCHAFL